MVDAPCKGATVVFFGSNNETPSIKSRRINQAKDICQTCPFETQCLQLALAYGPATVGIWGGTTEEERAVWVAKEA